MAYQLMRWSPIHKLTSFQEEIEQLCSSLRCNSAQDRSFLSLLWAPLVDVEESKDEVIVRAELPGLKKENLKVEAHGSTLLITGERKASSEAKDKRFHLVERSYGRFQRAVELPVAADIGKIKASYQDGVLTVRVPRPEDAKPKEVSIEIQ